MGVCVGLAVSLLPSRMAGCRALWTRLCHRSTLEQGSAPEAVLIQPFNARRLCAEVRLVITENP